MCRLQCWATSSFPPFWNPALSQYSVMSHACLPAFPLGLQRSGCPLCSPYLLPQHGAAASDIF